MSRMLTEYDIAYMEDTVRDVIKQWRTTITIRSPLPIDKQPNYNKYMKEYTGPMEYEERVVQAERKDIVNNYTNDIFQEFNIYGDYEKGTILYAIPNIITTEDESGEKVITAYKPNENDIVKIDDSDNLYYVRAMRDRIGETLLVIQRYVGGTPDGMQVGNLEDNEVNEEPPIDTGGDTNG